MSKIELKWKDRAIGGAQTPRRFLDFIVDGESFYEKLGDVISPLGWGSPEHNRIAMKRFLLLEPADFPADRRSIYVCPECGDLGCGAVSAVIEKVGNQIVWRDFGYENNYDESVLFNDYKDVGPYIFDAREYATAFKRAELAIQ